MRLAIIVELVGISVVAAGIGYEIATRADLGFVFITVGSLLVAGGEMYSELTTETIPKPPETPAPERLGPFWCETCKHWCYECRWLKT